MVPWSLIWSGLMSSARGAQVAERSILSLDLLEAVLTRDRIAPKVDHGALAVLRRQYSDQTSVVTRGRRNLGAHTEVLLVRLLVTPRTTTACRCGAPESAPRRGGRHAAQRLRVHQWRRRQARPGERAPPHPRANGAARRRRAGSGRAPADRAPHAARPALPAPTARFCSRRAAPPGYAMQQTGHTTPTLALSIYNRVLERKRDTGERMSELLRGPDTDAGIDLATSLSESA